VLELLLALLELDVALAVEVELDVAPALELAAVPSVHASAH
jgi:hypothetical protein